MSEVAIVDLNTGELQQYKPQESLQNMAVAEVAEKHYRRAKDLDGLHRAIEAIWTERYNFCVWWDGQEKDKGGGDMSDESTRNRSVTGAKHLEEFSLNKMVVSRWRQKLKLKDDAGLENLIEATFNKAKNTIDPNALADKHTGDQESYTTKFALWLRRMN
jgi:hypothetical protein